MTYQADHLAWQQRVNQEFKAQSSTQESQKFLEQGQWLNYPDLVEYLKSQQNINNGGIQKNARAFGQNYKLGSGYDLASLVESGVVSRRDLLTNSRQRNRSQRGDDTGSQYSYTGKSKILYQRGGTKRSTSSAAKNPFAQIGPYTGQQEDTKSRLSKNNVQRFNEVIEHKAPSERGPKSFVSQARSKVSAASQKPSVFSKQSYLKKKQEIQQKEKEANIDAVEPVISAEQQQELEQQILDELEAQDKVEEQPAVLESASQIQPSKSELSKMSGKTYISQLHKQLEEEKLAREALESELQDLKKVSEEINSHLSSLKKQQQGN